VCAYLAKSAVTKDTRLRLEFKQAGWQLLPNEAEAVLFDMEQKQNNNILCRRR